MNSVLKNIKTTLRQLFGFDEIEKNKEWNDYLVALGQNGYFSSKEIETFKKSENYITKLEERLEENEASIKNRKKSFQIDSLELNSSVVEPTVSLDAKEKEREKNYKKLLQS